MITALEHDYGIISQSSIIRVDLPDLTQTMLVESDQRGLIVTERGEPGRVFLRDKKGNPRWLDPETGEVTPQK